MNTKSCQLAYIIAILISVNFISGCNGLGRVGSPMWDLTTSPEEKFEVYSANCQQYGYKIGTVEFTDCIRDEKYLIDQKVQARKKEWRERRAERDKQDKIEALERRVRNLELYDR